MQVFCLESFRYLYPMNKRGPKIILTQAILKDQIRIEDELTKIITKIVDELIKEEKALRNELENDDYAILGDSISKFAYQAELKIQIKQLRKIKSSILLVLKRSTNKMILASIEVAERIN
jgi:hypothetical protein